MKLAGFRSSDKKIEELKADKKQCDEIFERYDEKIDNLQEQIKDLLDRYNKVCRDRNKLKLK